MKKKLLRFIEILEMIIAVFILIAVIITIASLVNDLWILGNNPTEKEGFNNFLGAAFSVIIGIEFLKMLFKHTPGAVIEVLLFAISRQLVVEHTTSFENLIGVVAIAVIFAIRKYLYVSVFNEKEKTCINPKEECPLEKKDEHILMDIFSKKNKKEA